MTKELLQAAILRLQAKALEHYGMIKDLYHNPASENTVDEICSHSVALAQFEGAMLTLQGYLANLSEPQQPTPSAEETDSKDFQIELEEPKPDKLSQEELEQRSPTMRRSAGSKKKTYKTKSK